MTWGAIGGAAVATVGGALLNKNKGGSTTSTSQQQIDPRLQALLYGEGVGSTGLAQQIAQQAQKTQSPGQANFGAGIDSYLGGWGLDNFMRSQQNAQRLQETQHAAPQAGNIPGINTSLVNAAQVNAPAQNKIDLTGAYNNFIYGNAGNNPYLTQGLKAAEDATTAGFQSRANALTDNLQKSVLPGLKQNAILSGSFGGSRQGIAEGNALSDYTRQLTDANSQLSATNNANAINAQAQSFNAGQDRALAATQGLGAQQYGVASQNAALQQQAALANQNAFQNSETSNAQLRTQRDLANLQAQLSTTQQNDARNIAGIGLSSGLLGQAVGYGTNAQNSDWQRLLQGTNTLSGLAGNNVTTSTSPYYTNTGANLLGGAAAGLGLYNQFQQANNSGPGSSSWYANNDYLTS